MYAILKSLNSSTHDFSIHANITVMDRSRLDCLSYCASLSAMSIMLAISDCFFGTSLPPYKVFFIVILPERLISCNRFPQHNLPLNFFCTSFHFRRELAMFKIFHNLLSNGKELRSFSGRGGQNRSRPSEHSPQLQNF